MTHISQLIMVKSPREGLFFSLAFGVCDVEEKRRINGVTARFSRPECVADHFQDHGQLRELLRSGLPLLPQFSNKGRGRGKMHGKTRASTFHACLRGGKEHSKKERKETQLRSCGAACRRLVERCSCWRWPGYSQSLAIWDCSVSIDSARGVPILTSAAIIPSRPNLAWLTLFNLTLDQVWPPLARCDASNRSSDQLLPPTPSTSASSSPSHPPSLSLPPSRSPPLLVVLQLGCTSVNLIGALWATIIFPPDFHRARLPSRTYEFA